MLEKLHTLQAEAETAILETNDITALRDLKVKYLGKKGELTSILRGMGGLPAEERPQMGKVANEVRGVIESLLIDRETALEEAELEERLQLEKLDVTLPGISQEIGTAHPLNSMIEKIEDIFIGMGFGVAEGPEVETDQYNFEALNLPKEHPARDMQDSFYINPEMLLRTHTSSVQIRTLEAKKGEAPVRIICPGKVYRRDDDDATHSHQFTQIEGLVVDQNVSMSELNGVLFAFAQKMFGAGIEMRLRPSFFPFTEPSVEVDIYHPEKGWIEILGAGMVHPDVLARVGYDPEVYTGFAFGVGVERIAILKYDIDDIRQLYTNDLRFLDQFKSV
ncbi:phenylalanine--tRNA ligase subunit alpha [Hazenella sp. IB182357]|uniref:Phenylalanine--tRNA ligase alpha subunit n=1 Tax=Polycladospora coralii TaxID=2771432 RepID=A0A926NFW9_9BACL|nr:phenylalanine--tRNA ligase subunit alpha [Polycladospora coralii]MBD1372819.1 phenylalanine--tRNA ligase subunit alpha [Polycladospora coralii]MBS7529483.1 phenylalanine--tRNA ligase subunit alpha [Polycladospora coralii]